MTQLETIARALLLVIVATLPFEFRALPQEFSFLQLLFFALVLVSIPIVVRDWRKLASNRLVVGAAGFVAIYWLTALTADGFTFNSIEAALRVSFGFVLLCIALCIGHKLLDKVFGWAAVVAATYGVLDYLGLGIPSLFRSAEFYVGNIHRLSGSFEYPNIAATFYAMSLPIVWTQLPVFSLVVWIALVLTFSRGAILAIFAALIVGHLLRPAQKWLSLALIGLAICLIGALFQPLLAGRLRSSENRIFPPPKARYVLELNQLKHQPGSAGQMPITIQNIGSASWNEVVLSSHWYDVQNKRLVSVPEVLNPLPLIVEPNQMISMQAAFRTPLRPGVYLLSWDLKVGSRWFSISAGVPPGIVEATLEPDSSLWLGKGDTGHWYGVPGGLDASVQRFDLWMAAMQLFRADPIFGIGPDNFRLRYGEFLGYPRWDTNVRANSLYLELLTGSGILGLLAFGLMMASVRWTIQPAALSLGVFLIHGLVDVFLMTTSIYFAFWLLLGRVHADRV